MALSKYREEGSAGIIVELSNGVISVYHESDRSLLFRKNAYSGDWEKIWKAIKK